MSVKYVLRRTRSTNKKNEIQVISISRQNTLTNEEEANVFLDMQSLKSSGNIKTTNTAGNHLQLNVEMGKKILHTETKKEILDTYSTQQDFTFLQKKSRSSRISTVQASKGIQLSVKDANSEMLFSFKKEKLKSKTCSGIKTSKGNLCIVKKACSEITSSLNETKPNEFAVSNRLKANKTYNKRYVNKDQLIILPKEEKWNTLPKNGDLSELSINKKKTKEILSFDELARLRTTRHNNKDYPPSKAKVTREHKAINIRPKGPEPHTKHTNGIPTKKELDTNVYSGKQLTNTSESDFIKNESVEKFFGCDMVKSHTLPRLQAPKATKKAPKSKSKNESIYKEMEANEELKKPVKAETLIAKLIAENVEKRGSDISCHESQSSSKLPIPNKPSLSIKSQLPLLYNLLQTQQSSSYRVKAEPPPPKPVQRSRTRSSSRADVLKRFAKAGFASIALNKLSFVRKPSRFSADSVSHRSTTPTIRQRSYSCNTDSPAEP